MPKLSDEAEARLQRVLRRLREEQPKAVRYPSAAPRVVHPDRRKSDPTTREDV